VVIGESEFLGEDFVILLEMFFLDAELIIGLVEF
jgi:hypothetical protein